MEAESLVQAFEPEEALQKPRARLLAGLGLELREPLAAVAGLADLVLEGQLDEEQREYVTLIRKVTGDVIRLLDEARSLMDLELHPRVLLEEEFNLREVIDAAIDDCCGASRAEAGRGEEVRVVGSLPEIVRGDPFKLRQLLAGLVRSSNHTCPGAQVRCQISCQPEPEGWLLVVKGNCSPREPAQGSDTEPRPDGEFQGIDFTSAAIGWALVYRLATLMRGSLSLSITPFEGGRSELLIPLGRVEESE